MVLIGRLEKEREGSPGEVKKGVNDLQPGARRARVTRGSQPGLPAAPEGRPQRARAALSADAALRSPRPHPRHPCSHFIDEAESQSGAERFLRSHDWT